MTQVPASSHGVSSAGGTFTGPITVQGTPGTSENIFLVYNDVRPIAPPATAGEAFSVTGDGSVFFRSGDGSIALNVVSQDGANFLNYRSGVGLGVYVGSAAVHQLLSSSLGFYGAAPTVQPAAITNAAGGVVIDIEARAALNSLLAAIRALGLIAT